MEAFSLLKYWRQGGGGYGGATSTAGVFTPDSKANAKATTKTSATTTAAAVSPYSSDGEDGPYFDLEFAIPDQESDIDEETSTKSQENDQKAPDAEDEDETASEEISLHDDEEEEEEDEEEEEEGELKFALTSKDCTDQNVSLSPSDELFFKGDLVSIEPSSIVLNGGEENSKFPVFLVKSATKFRVLLLKLKKAKSGSGQNPEKAEKDENQGNKVSSKFFAVKLEEVPIVSMFTRDSSSKENQNKGMMKHNNVEDSEERKLTKEVMQKYLKMVKPFYVRVSKRYVEKLKFSGHLSGGSKDCAAGPPPPETAAGVAPTNVKTQQKQGNNLQAGLKVVRKHLGKSRSAPAAVTAAEAGKVTSNRRDDSLLQVQDGIQGAILHCKRSFNASRGDAESSSILCRSVSDPSSYEKSVIKPKVCWASSSSSSPASMAAKGAKGLA